MKPVQALVALLATVVMTHSQVSAEAPSAFAAAARTAKANEATSEGKAFDAAVGLQFGQRHADTMNRCAKGATADNLTKFDLLMKLGAGGQVVEALVYPETAVAICLQKAVARDSYPKPAHADYWVRVGMSIVADDQSQSTSPPLVVVPSQYSFTFDVPAGWTFSFEEARRVGLPLVLFPKGGGFDQSSSIVYINYACRSDCTGKLAAAIDRVVRESAADSPNLHVESDPDILLSGGAKAAVRVLSGASDKRQAREALAFIEHKSAIIMVVLTTKDPSNWASDYEALRQIVTGHKFFDCASPDLAVPCR